MTQFDFWLERLARRVRWGEFLHRVANWLAVYLLAAGTIVLVGKLVVPRQSWPGPLEAADQQAVAWLLALVVLGFLALRSGRVPLQPDETSGPCRLARLSARGRWLADDVK